MPDPAQHQTTIRYEFCEACHVWHYGPCTSPRVPEIILSPGWLRRDIKRASMPYRHLMRYASAPREITNDH